MSFISRILAGHLADIFRKHIYSFFLLCMILTGLSITLFPLSTHYYILLILISVYGLFAGVSNLINCYAVNSSELSLHLLCF